MGCGSALPTSPNLQDQSGTEEGPLIPELVQQAQIGGAPSTHVLLDLVHMAWSRDGQGRAPCTHLAGSAQEA